MDFPVRISIALDLTLVTTREKVVSWKIFFVHLFIIFWESITSKIFSALILTQKKKKDSLHAIIAYKNYSNTQKGNFSLAPHHLQGRKLICRLKIK